MKQDIENHINNIFITLNITSPFEVYEYNFDELPEWTNQIQITNEFIVCCNDFLQKQKLQIFIGKKVFEYGEYIYWFEGERISEILQLQETGFIAAHEEEQFVSLKTETRLPDFLDDLIYNHFNAKYAPDFKRFDYNLDLTKEEILQYLGTYFPRSYAESFCIFDNIFLNEAYQQTIFNKTSLNFLSVGSGTGGDIIGLLAAVEKHFQNALEINIWALDGNKEALFILENVIDNFKMHTSKNIYLKTIVFIFDSMSNFQNEEIIDKKFDYILSFKFIGEVISQGKGIFDNSYYDYTHKFLPLLTTVGLFVLLDVTTKPLHNTYNPILLNKQVNKALRELDAFEALLPLSCCYYSENCLFDCFQQKTFTVTHSRHINDKSRVAYRILVSNEMKRIIGIKVDKCKHQINNNKVCPFTQNGTKLIDAFYLKSIT